MASSDLRENVLLRKILLAAVLMLVVGGSLRFFTTGDHPSILHPRPDGLEYLASAQSLAQSGLYQLTIGNSTVPPRYPPGWPLLLSAGLWSGIQVENIWMLTSKFGALYVAMLAFSVCLLVRKLHPSMTLGAELLVLVLASFVLSNSSMIKAAAIRNGSDIPAAALGLGALLVLASSLIGTGKIRYLGGFFSGLLLAMTAAVRPLDGFLFGIIVGVILLVSWMKAGRQRALLLGLSVTLGGALVVAVVSGVLYRSGWNPWSWSHYEFWIPNKYGEFTDVFNWRFLIKPIQTYPVLDFSGQMEGIPLSNLQVMAITAAGLFPVSREVWCFGLFWPLLFSGGALFYLKRLLRRDDADSKVLGWIILLWLLLRILFYGTYFFPAGRFHILLMSTLFVLGLAYFTVLIHEGGWIRRLGSILAIVAALVGTVVVMEKADYSSPRDRHMLHLRAHEKWMEVYSTMPATQPVPFDPVVVQAYGRMDAETEFSMRGRMLPNTGHTFRLSAAHADLLPRERVTARSAEWEARRFLVEQRLREPRDPGSANP